MRYPNPCEGRELCYYEYAHYSFPGMDFIFGEVFARLGDKNRALGYFNRSLDYPAQGRNFDQSIPYPDSNKWVNNQAARAYIASLDDKIKRFQDRGNRRNVMDLLQFNRSPTSCLMCHQPIN